MRYNLQTQMENDPLIKLNSYQAEQLKRIGEYLRTIQPQMNHFKEAINSIALQTNWDYLGKYIQNFNRQISDAFIQSSKLKEQLAYALSPTIDALNRIRESFSYLPKTVNFFMEHAKIAEKLIETGKAWHELEKNLISIGWFPVGDWTVINARHLIKLFNEKKISKINAYMLRYLTKEKILKILKKWEESKTIKKNRLKVLKNALNAHLRKEYDLAISAFLPQIEGIIRSFVKEYGDSKHHRILARFISKIKKTKKGNPSKEELIGLVHTAILKNLFLNHGKSKRSRKIHFTRNSVLHGLNVKDFNKTNSLKLILLTDYLIHQDELVG